MLERLRIFYNKNRISGQKVNAEQNIDKASRDKEAELAKEAAYETEQSNKDRLNKQQYPTRISRRAISIDNYRYIYYYIGSKKSLDVPRER